MSDINKKIEEQSWHYSEPFSKMLQSTIEETFQAGAKAMRELLPSDLDRLKAVVEEERKRISQITVTKVDTREIHVGSAAMQALEWVLERIEDVRGEG